MTKTCRKLFTEMMKSETNDQLDAIEWRAINSQIVNEITFAESKALRSAIGACKTE